MIKPECIEIKSVGNITFLACDHRPERITDDPWEAIEDQIQRSSLVFVEYFPPELEKTAYRNRLLGRWARKDAESTGINSFFNGVASLAARYRKDIAVADIANKPLYVVYYAGSMFTPPIPAIAVNAFEGTKLMALPLLFACAYLSLYSHCSTFFEKVSPGERFTLNMLDARRVLTAKALARTAQEQPAANLLYIGPHAHVNRIANYLEHSESLSYRIKCGVCSLLPGLDKKTRVYRYDTADDSWRKV